MEEELTALKSQVAEREDSLAAREKSVSDKELTLKKALATVKKLKFQLNEAKTQVIICFKWFFSLPPNLVLQHRNDPWMFSK